MDERDNSSGMFTPNSPKGSPQDIKFYDARSSEDPVAFKAFLTSFSDKYVSNWSEKTVYGRMDPIYTYQNTTRVINFALDVPAYGILEGRDNLEKFSRLIRMIYPTFAAKNEGHGIKTSPVIGIKFGNLISDAGGSKSRRGLFGVLGGVEVSPDTETGFFLAPGDDKDMNLIPKLYKASFEFKPLHSHLVGKASDNPDWINFPYNMTAVSSAVVSSDQAALEGGGLSDIVAAMTTMNLDG
jgi:hypothetical protein